MRIFLLLALITHLSSFSALANNQQKPTIVALSPHIVEMLFAIGAGEQIIATTEYSDHPKAAKSIPRIGNHAGLQIEKFIKH